MIIRRRIKSVALKICNCSIEWKRNAVHRTNTQTSISNEEKNVKQTSPECYGSYNVFNCETINFIKNLRYGRCARSKFLYALMSSTICFAEVPPFIQLKWFLLVHLIHAEGTFSKKKTKPLYNEKERKKIVWIKRSHNLAGDQQNSEFFLNFKLSNNEIV